MGLGSYWMRMGLGICEVCQILKHYELGLTPLLTPRIHIISAISRATRLGYDGGLSQSMSQQEESR